MNRIYATDFNKQFDDKKSHFVTLNRRIRRQFSKLDIKIIKNSLNEFKRRQTHSKFEHLTNAMCKARTTTLNNIQIDDTMQRRANPGHVSGIISGWVNSRMAPIQVYEDPENPGSFISWDGQHTVISLQLIADEFGEDLSKCVIPINEYIFTDRIEIRENFIRLATIGDKKQKGSDKLPMNSCEHFYQKVRAVRVDNYTSNIDYNTAEEKFQYIQNAKCFVTHSDYGDAHNAGAITRLIEINRFDPIITKQLCQYFNTLKQDRPIASNEIALITTYLNLCKEQKINVDSIYINQLADTNIKLFGADLNSNSKSNTFWDQCRNAYNNWHLNNPEKSGTPRMSVSTENGLSFLIAQMEKSLSGIKVPAFDGFKVKNKDLF